MTALHLQGPRMFFVPEASAAVKFNDTWENGKLHEAKTILISQWLAGLIKLEDFLNIEKLVIQ